MRANGSNDLAPLLQAQGNPGTLQHSANLSGIIHPHHSAVVEAVPDHDLRRVSYIIIAGMPPSCNKADLYEKKML